MPPRIHRSGLMAVICMLGLNSAIAADPPRADSAPPSREMREKMATFHERMAACLRSDKPIADCHTEMMKNAREVMGKDGCPMMKGGMMQDHPAAAADRPSGDHK